MTEFHQSVLLKETLKYLNVRQGKKYIDATVGGAGHAVEIVKCGGEVLGLDVDSEAIEFAKEMLEARSLKLDDEAGSWKLEKGNFKNIEKIAKENDFYPVAGVLYDLGLSSHQLEHSGRGFSFKKSEPLDMRADPDLKVTAADLVNGLSEKELTKLFEKYGEESRARAVAGAIIRSRWDKSIKTSAELTDIVEQVVRKPPFAKASGGKPRKRHPATKVFQALRIAVNDELNNLKSSLPPAFGLLEPRGRLVVISFHSLEDRIVKNYFRTGNLDGEVKKDFYGNVESPFVPVNRNVIQAGEEEISQNPRARSAKLRIAEKRVFDRKESL